MTLTDIATTDVVTASSDTGVRDLLDQMDDQMVGSIVITDGDELVGIVTDRSIALELRNVDSVDDVTAEDVMTADPVSVGEDDSHFDVLETMSAEGIRRIPITDNGSVTGIITLDDLLMVTAAELSNASDVIEQQAGSR